MQTPLWKRILIWGLCVLGILFAMPNLFYDRVERHNDAAAAIAAANGVATPEQAADLALWPSWLPSGIVPLGLDLRGGAHLLARVHVTDIYAQRIDGMWPDVRDNLRGVRDQVGSVRRVPSDPGVLRVSISNPAGMQVALEKIRALAQPVVSVTGIGSNDIEVTQEGDEIVIQLSAAERASSDTRTMQQSLEIIRRRVDEVGTREPTIQRQGSDRILIQVPGIGSAAELKDLIGTTAQLTFNPVVGRTTDAKAVPGARNVLLPSTSEQGVYYIIAQTPVVSGEELVDAQPAFDQNGRPAVNFRFNPTGARAFGDYTAANIGQPFAIVLDDEVISAPTIQSAIPGGSGIITGNFTVEESTNLAVLLRAGALPAKMDFLEERTIGPELGADSITAGERAAAVGAVLVGVFMVLCYGWFGMMANIALAMNIILIMAVLSVMGATLTLPGIAGIVLTFGVSVDANVLIFERMRDELRNGRSALRAMEEGFARANSAIVDANVTGLLTAMIMYIAGSGPIRGFAITYGVGILTSIFTAIWLTRMIINAWYGIRRPKTIVV